MIFLWIFTISSLFIFQRSRNPLLTFLLSYHVWVTSKIQVNFPVWDVLMILSYKFLKMLHYSCFRDQGIHCWYFCRATMFGWPQKSRQTSGSTRTRRCWWMCLVHFWNFFTIYVLRSGNPLLTFLLNYYVWGPQQFRSTSSQRGFRVYPNIRSLTENALNL